MPDTLGSISIPAISPSGTFPIVSDFPHRMERDYVVARHVFGAGNRKREQRYLLGTGARKFTVYRTALNNAAREALRDFWEARSGPYGAFTYNAPSDDGASTTAYTVRFANEPLSWQMIGPAMAQGQCVLIEIPADGAAPSYSISSTVTRFPAGGLATSLLNQEQELLPLLKITAKASGYPAMYISDRRVTVGGQLYLARMTNWDGISQSIGSGSDDASFSFGNADNVMTLLSADTDLYKASVEFSLFWVNGSAGIKIDLWKGEITDWQDDEGPEFRVKASDGFHELRLPYPTRKFSRSCWKDLDDGNGCPYSSAGSGGDPAECDKGYNTPKGCASHGMRRYFGGIIAEPQGVLIRDNQIKRNITATSIVNDSVYDRVVKEIYTDSTMPVAADVVAGRDESDFYEAMGVVGEGPITFDTAHKVTINGTPTDIGQTLDGSFNHGYPGSLGLRTMSGTDPAGATDFFSLDQSGNQVGSDPEKIFSGASTYLNRFAAGTAAAVIRRADEKGIQLTRPSEHEMKCYISGGLQGWVWTGAGTRSLATLSNPVWIAVNMVLRARGLRFASAATAEQYFDVSAAIAAAAICDASVTKIAGLSGSETQYKFRGVIGEEKPLRDWLDEVLMNCMGYYTFAFGKMKIGVRSNSSTVEAFTTGNVLADSVRLSPLKPSFNDITAVFADELYDYAQNSINVYSMDHQKLVGGAAAPLKMKVQLNLSGTSGASQAARICQTRLKEELGGATAAEWKLARNVAIRTTVLALAVEPGMVCSLTHEKMPGGAGEFRVTGWKLNKDYSIDLEGKTTTDSMYDAVQGPKPADVLPSPIPIEQVNYPLRPACMGFTRSTSDPILDQNEFLPGAAESYETAVDGSVEGRVLVNAFVPRNRYLDCPPPIIRGAGYLATGGTLLAGRNYFLQAMAYQGEKTSPPSNILAVAIPAGADTAQATIDAIAWPVCPSGSWDGYKLLAGHTEQTICEQLSVAGTLVTSDAVDTGPLRQFHTSAAAPNFDRARARVKLIYSGGPVRAKVTAVTSTTIVCGDLAGGGDAFAGRKVSIISDASDGRPGIWNFTCSAYDQSTGTFTVSPDPAAAGIEADDMLQVRTAPSSTSTSVTDTKWNFASDEVAGKFARILYGTGKGQVRPILSNTATALTIEPAWSTNPDSSSIVIIEEPEWAEERDSAAIETMSNKSIEIAVPFPYVQVPVLVAVFGVDRFGQLSPEEQVCARDMYFRGEPFVTEIGADYTVTPNDRILMVTASSAVNLTLPKAKLGRGRVVIKRKAGAAAINLVASGSDTLEASSVSSEAVLFPRDKDSKWYLEASGSGTGTASISTQDVTLVAGPGTTTITSTASPVDGAMLVLDITQHASGGRQIALSSQFHSSCPVDIAMGPNEKTRMQYFGKSDSKWHFLSSTALLF